MTAFQMNLNNVYIRLSFLVCGLATLLGLLKASFSNLIIAGNLNLAQFLFYYISSAVIWFTFIPVMYHLLQQYRITKANYIKPVFIIIIMAICAAFSQRLFSLVLDFSIRKALSVIDYDSPYSLKYGIVDTLFSIKPILFKSSLDNLLVIFIGIILFYTFTKNNRVDSIRLSDGTVLRLDDIEIISAKRNYVEVMTADNTFLSRTTICKFYKTLGDDFVRIHRSHIIRKTAVKSVEPLYHKSYKVRTQSGRWINSGPKYSDSINRLI